MKRYLLKLLLWCYRDAVKDFTKLSTEEEFNLYKLSYGRDVVKLIKYLQTCQILWFYEAKTDEERATVKGASMILKIMLDSHNEVMEIIENEVDETKQLQYWDRFKKKNRTT